MFVFLYVNLQFEISVSSYQEYTTRSFTKRGERTKSVLSTYFGVQGPPRCRLGARSRKVENRPRPHTPSKDWPAAQSLRADTSGQPLPRSSRLLLPALGKKSGQRGAGTKDPAVHGDRGLRATPRQVPGTDALSSPLHVPRSGPRGVLAGRAPTRSPHRLLTAGNHAHSPPWPPLSSGGSSFLSVRRARSGGPLSPRAQA